MGALPATSPQNSNSAPAGTLHAASNVTTHPTTSSNAGSEGVDARETAEPATVAALRSFQTGFHASWLDAMRMLEVFAAAMALVKALSTRFTPAWRRRYGNARAIVVMEEDTFELPSTPGITSTPLTKAATEGGKNELTTAAMLLDPNASFNVKFTSAGSRTNALQSPSPEPPSPSCCVGYCGTQASCRVAAGTAASAAVVVDV